MIMENDTSDLVGQIVLLERRLNECEKQISDYQRHHALYHEECAYMALSDSNQLSTMAHNLTPRAVRNRLSYGSAGCNRGRNNAGQHSSLRVHTESLASTKSGKNKNNTWKSVADVLIARTPTSDRWWQRIDELECSSLLMRGEVIKFLLDINFSWLSTSNTERQDESTDLGWVFNIATDYAYAISKRCQNSRATLKLLQIQKFLGLCICAVLSNVLRGVEGRQLTTAKARLHDLTNVAMGKELTQVYTRRLWEGAKVLNEILDALASCGWSLRANELLLFWDLPNSFYRNLSYYSKDMSTYLISQLSQSKYTQEVAKRPQWVVFNIPVLLCQILKKTISVDRIALCLGYQRPYDLGVLINPWKFFIRSRHLLPSSDPEIECRWLNRYFIGRGISQHCLVSAFALKHAAACDIYKELHSIDFLYENLEGTEIAKPVVMEWASNPRNVRDAASVFDNWTPRSVFTLRAYSAFRFKAHHAPGREFYTVDGLSVDERKYAVVVIIALETLNGENGCFVNLQPGQHVCFNGSARVPFPGTGGGLGVFIDGYVDNGP